MLVIEFFKQVFDVFSFFSVEFFFNEMTMHSLDKIATPFQLSNTHLC